MTLAAEDQVPLPPNPVRFEGQAPNVSSLNAVIANLQRQISGFKGGGTDMPVVIPQGFTVSALQAAVNTAQANGSIPVIVPAGNYVWNDGETLTMTAIFDAPTNTNRLCPLLAYGHVVFDSSAFTTVQNTITVNGVSGKNCASQMSGIVFTGSQTNSIHVNNFGLNNYVVDNCIFLRGIEAARASNTFSGIFTEGFRLHNCTFRIGIGTVLHYLVSGSGDFSFNSTGLTGENLWEASGDFAALLIDNHAFPYNAPLHIRVQCNAVSGTNHGIVIVENHQTSVNVQAQFRGAITYEAFAVPRKKIILGVYAGTGSPGRITFSGPINGVGGSRGSGSNGERISTLGFSLGNATWSQWTNRNSGAQTQVMGDTQSIQLPLNPGTTTIGSVPGSGVWHVNISASNYRQHSILNLGRVIANAGFPIDVDGTYIDNNGWGRTSITIDSNGVLALTNANFPCTANKPTVVIDEINYSQFSTPETSGQSDTNHIFGDYREAHDFIDTAVNIGSNTIAVDDTYNLWTGRGMPYFALNDATASTPGSIGGLTSGTTYYAIVVDDFTVKLALQPSDAFAGTAIDLTSVSAGTGNWTFRLSY